ncbi:MAG: glycoside hydrolase family 97 N-terminal domain-containing protein, partial [Bacteroidales bacterium]|nr:glycoside hydrolase family 97 N-terminal domain-containing protein [Bacteroidales bacterium]
MRNIILLIIGILVLNACKNNKNEFLILSPNEINKIEIGINKKGEIEYSVSHNNTIVIKPSKLGFDFNDGISLNSDFKLLASKTSNFEETWEMQWGEQLEVKNKYNELFIELQKKDVPYTKINIRFKAYNDGIAFRYEFPEQSNLTELIIINENTEFNLTGNHKTWWIPGDWDIYEHLYNTTNFNKVNAIVYRNNNSLAQSYIPYNAVNTPVTMKTSEGLYLSFHEANLTNYAGMTLLVDTINLSMKSKLVASDKLGYAAKIPIPFNTPWRTIQIADKATQLIESNLITNLNEPNKLG